MPKLHTVYDFRDQAIFPWEVYFFFVLTVIAAPLFFATRKNNTPDSLLSNIKHISLAVGVVCLVGLLFTFKMALKDYLPIKQIFDEKQYSIVEGRVQEYHPMPASGHDSERFRVGDLYFKMCDFDETIIGYNHAASLGGVIRPNLYVRIWYPTHGRIAILHLETE